MAEAAKSATAAVQAVEQASLLDRIVEEGRFTYNDAARERGKDLVKVFVQEVLERAATVPKDAETAINARIAQIDNLAARELPHTARRAAISMSTYGFSNRPSENFWVMMRRTDSSSRDSVSSPAFTASTSTFESSVPPN